MAVNCAINSTYIFRAGSQVFKFVLGLYAKHMQIYSILKSHLFASPSPSHKQPGLRSGGPLRGWWAGMEGSGGRAVREAAQGRSLGGAGDAPSWPAAGLDLSLSPPGAAAAPLVAPRLQKGLLDSSLGQSGAGSWNSPQLPPVRNWIPSSQSCGQLSRLPGAAVARGPGQPLVAEPRATLPAPRPSPRVGLSLGARWGSRSSALPGRCLWDTS